MRLGWIALWLAVAPAMHAGVVSQNWRESKLTLQLDDGAAEIEWISAESFRIARSWGEGLPAVPKIVHEPVLVALDGEDGNPRMRSRYLTVELDRASLKLRVRNGETDIAEAVFAQSAREMEVRISPMGAVYGLGGGNTGRLNLHGEELRRGNGFFLTGDGYGIFMRYPSLCTFSLNTGSISSAGAHAVDFVFYYGPSPKEILEQHQKVIGQTELTGKALGLLSGRLLPREATLLPRIPLTGWPVLAELVRTLNHQSFSGILYPAFDLAIADKAPTDIRQRARDLASILPMVYRTSGDGGIDLAARNAFMPYFITYLREAHDRGYPLIRPLAMEFSRDAGMDRQADVFMLGDEFLVAPVVSASERRRVELPRGLWTDLRTNIEYRGNQAIEVDAPAGRVPLFTRNGSLFPLAAVEKMELHYFPSLGGEFLLWEPSADDNSQFHAAPAGDFMRVEIESKAARTYEWVLHHTGPAKDVAEDREAYQRVDERGQLKPGTWWHDDQQNNLHVMLMAAAESDRIVNISF